MNGTEWLFAVAVLLVGLTLVYYKQMDNIKGYSGSALHKYSEGFTDYITALEGPDSFLPEAGAFPNGEQVLLKDFLKVKTGLSDMTAASCASADSGRQAEVGGQYVQRTNNYRRDSPDSCTAFRPDFVGSVYEPTNLGQTVPCDGDC